jgi:hypothetical protein
MQKGDIIIFLFTSSRGMAQPKDSRTIIKIHRFYICEIIEPYYMVLDDNRGLFFEDQIERPSIGDRKWPHFIDFKIKKEYVGGKELLFGPQGRFSEPFANSFNHGGGTPYPLSRAQYEQLKDRLFKLVKDIS